MAIYFYKKLWDAEIHTSWVCFDGIQRRYVSSENPPVEPNTSKVCLIESDGTAYAGAVGHGALRDML